MIITQPYFTVTRKIINGSQKVTHEEQYLCMYKDKICTGILSLSISEIYDLSFRKLNQELGILYLHTNHGVYPFKVREEPNTFIEKFYQLKS